MSQFPPNQPSFSAPPTLGSALNTPPKTSVLAIVSLVLGILGICIGITAPIGVILGIIAIVQITKSQGRLGGIGLAIAGTCVSAAVIVMISLALGLLLPALATARQSAQRLKAITMVSMVGKAQLTYAGDHAGQYPPVDDWMTALRPYAANIDELVISPLEPDSGRWIAMNASLGSQSTNWRASRIPSLVLLFECEYGSPLSGGAELLPSTPRSPAGYFILFEDNHTEFVRLADIDRLPWKP